jgi:hypothetical protein
MAEVVEVKAQPMETFVFTHRVPSTGGTGKIEFQFKPPLEKEPKAVFVQPLQGRDFGWPEWQDVFATCVNGKDKEKIEIAYRRVDNNGAGYEMHLNLQVMLVF